MLLCLQIAISFVAGGIFIALQTLVAERFHGMWRGIILTIPSTMALGLFFIGLTKSAADVPEASIMIPAVTGVDYFFIMVFAILARHGFLTSILGSLAVWAAGAYVLLNIPPATFAISAFIYGLPLIIIAYLMTCRLPQVPYLKPFPIIWKNILIRSLIGSFVIGTATILANTLGNIWGGLFSAFPAVFISTFTIYYFFHGKQVIPSVAKTVFFPGAIGLILYGYTATIVFPIWGIWLGTLVSYTATFIYFTIHIGISKYFRIFQKT